MPGGKPHAGDARNARTWGDPNPPGRAGLGPAGGSGGGRARCRARRVRRAPPPRRAGRGGRPSGRRSRRARTGRCGPRGRSAPGRTSRRVLPVHERPGLLRDRRYREHHVGPVGDGAGPQLEAEEKDAVSMALSAACGSGRSAGSTPAITRPPSSSPPQAASIAAVSRPGIPGRLLLPRSCPPRPGPRGGSPGGRPAAGPAGRPPRRPRPRPPGAGPRRVARPTRRPACPRPRARRDLG